MRERKPFERSWLRRVAAAAEFKTFQGQARDAIMAAAEDMPDHRILLDHFSFYVHIDHPDTIQAWFGQRRMFRKDLEGKQAFEDGVQLIYSLGPTGDVAVSLIPCKSPLAHVLEERLYIGLGNFTAYELRSRVRSDLRALVAYGYVSSLDAESTRGEWLRIAWLRRTKPSQVDGKYVAGNTKLVGSSLGAAFRAALLGAFTAFMRPVGYVVVALLLLRYGHGAWIDFFRSK